MRKRRLLIVNEFSQIATGFAYYMNGLMQELHKDGRFELFELSSYISSQDPRTLEVPWKVYGVLPENQQQAQIFAQDGQNQFGKWKFEEVLLDCKADEVLVCRDPWFDSFINQSPYRKYFDFIWMSTFDSEPYRQEWADDLKDCDRVLAYSDYGKRMIEAQSGGKIKVAAVPYSGVETDKYGPPESKDAVKNSLGIESDTMVFGTVMRNQPRKLFPELLRTFAKYLEYCESKGEHELAGKSYLYLHTGIVDVGWDLKKEIQRCKLGHKVLFTYTCRQCRYTRPLFYSGEICVCPNCRQMQFMTPGSNAGIPRDQLLGIMSCFDVYIQYTTCVSPETDILTDAGWKQIKNIQVGNRVLTHMGRYQKVVETIQNNGAGKPTRKITIKSDIDDLIITGNHPVLAYTHKVLKSENRNSLRECFGARIQTNGTIPEPEWIPALELKEGDLLAYTIDDTIYDIQKIDLADYAIKNETINENTIETKQGIIYNRYIEVDNDFCKLIGLMAADGCVDEDGQVKVTHHSNELENIDFVKNQFHKIYRKSASVREYRGRNAVDVYVCSTLHARLFLDCIGKSVNKQIPEWSLNLPLDKQKKILEGLFLGDGCYQNYKRRNAGYSSYTTISPTLAQQIKYLLNRLRVSYNLRLVDRSNESDGRNRRNQYKFEVYCDVRLGEFSSVRHNTLNVYWDKYYLKQIKAIENIDSLPIVYNMEVEEDHSYTTPIGTIKNCEGSGLPSYDAKLLGIPMMGVDYSATSDLANEPGGIPIKINEVYQEPLNMTYQLRSYPDNQDCVEKMFRLAKMTKEERENLGLEGYNYTKEKYSWAAVAKRWIDVIESLPLREEKETWLSPPKIINGNFQLPEGLNNADFVKYLWVNIAQEPKKIGGALYNKCINLLNQGYEAVPDGQGRINQVAVTRDSVVKWFIGYIGRMNQAEVYRYQKLVEGRMRPDLVLQEI